MAKIVIAAGASGGHVYPALATAVVLRERGHDITFAGGDRLEARVFPEAGFAFHALPSKRPPSVRIELLTPRGIAATSSIMLATVRARSLLKRLQPDVVLGMGGFAGVPVTLAAASRRLPLVLHEQNAHLSFAQRIPLRWATVLAQGLPIEEHVTHDRVELVGNPVREAIAAIATLDGDARRDAARRARERFGLDADKQTMLVLGGSLGSGPLNELVPQVRLPEGVQVLHLAGEANVDATQRAWGSASARVIGYLDDIENAYLAADVAISRSGASVIAELAIAGLGSILVPLTTLARGDQAANARVLERAGGAIVVAQATDGFVGAVETASRSLLSDAGRLASMSAAARSVARPDAAEALADVIGSVLRPA